MCASPPARTRRARAAQPRRQRRKRSSGSRVVSRGSPCGKNNRTASERVRCVRCWIGVLARREKGGREDERGRNTVVVRAARAPAAPARSAGAAEADHRGERARAARDQAFEDEHPGKCTTAMRRNEPGKKKPGRSRAFSHLETSA